MTVTYVLGEYVGRTNVYKDIAEYSFNRRLEENELRQLEAEAGKECYVIYIKRRTGYERRQNYVLSW